MSVGRMTASEVASVLGLVDNATSLSLVEASWLQNDQSAQLRMHSIAISTCAFGLAGIPHRSSVYLASQTPRRRWPPQPDDF